VSDHPETPTPSATPSPEVVTLTESAWSVAADLDDLIRQLPGDTRRSARMADRLAEELSELGAMARALPGRPADVPGHDHQLLAALRTAHAAHEDVAGTIARALARLAAELGSSSAVIQNRPESWEAEAIERLLDGTVGPLDEALPMYGSPGGLHGAGGPGGSL
jgi:ABC-type transporter Mla subunit MlaD